MSELAERYVKALNEKLINWTIVAYPNEGWATSVFGEPDVERLWDAVGSATRLDEPNPVEAWRAHIDKLEERAEPSWTSARSTAVRFRGPGTDLTVGLIPGADLVHRARGDGRRPPPRGEHADRGGLHDAGPPTHRGRRPLDDAARALRERRP